MRANALLISLFLWILASSVYGDNATSVPQSLSVAWQIGQQWQVNVDLFSNMYWKVATDSNKPKDILEAARKPLWQYLLTISVAGEETKDGASCWVIDFIPDKTAPDLIRATSYREWITKDAFELKAVACLTGDKTETPRLINAGSMTVIDAPAGFPLELIQTAFIAKETVPAGVPESELRVSVAECAKVRDVEQRITEPTTSRVVRQKWDAEHSWWIEYLKEEDGHKVLTAKLVRSIPPPADPNKN